eukprot:1833496-Rhodomonas_salina.3
MHQVKCRDTYHRQAPHTSSWPSTFYATSKAHLITDSPSSWETRPSWSTQTQPVGTIRRHANQLVDSCAYFTAALYAGK